MSILKKLIVGSMLAVLVACGGSNPTVPDVDAQSGGATVGSAPSTPPSAAPPVTPVESPFKFWEGQILPNAGWSVKNLNTVSETWTAYYTSFDNQTLVLGATTYTLGPNQWFEGTFSRTCVQVDIQQGVIATGQNASAAPFLSGFVNGYGKVVSAGQARDGCSVPTPDPTPTPSPSPEPTPTPTPSPSPSPSPTPPPPTCEQLSPPTFGAFTILADDEGNTQSIKATIQINSTGTWKLELYAASQTSEYPSNPDYTKPSVTKVLTCGQTFSLVNEYNWKNHESDEWWFKLYLNGVLKATSVRIHKD